MQRSKRGQDASHGGAWKLVYADFVTVVMAFYAVLWIMSIENVPARTVEDEASGSVKADAQICLQKTVDLLRARLIKDYGADSSLWPIQIDPLPNSLRLTLVDYQLPMFQAGKSIPSDFARNHLKSLGQIIQHCPDLPLKIEGYTDATPYIGGEQGYGNWELSTDRANAARRELLLNGVDGQRFWQVVGYGASKPVFPDSPNDPHNRRVSITIWVP